MNHLILNNRGLSSNSFVASARRLFLAIAASLTVMASPAFAQENVLNLYSARHYQTDEALYTNFTKATGIKINLIEGGEDALMERIRNEGTNSPADVFITVDVGRLWRAEQMGLFAPVKSKTLESRIPANYRDPDGNWFGFSRARASSCTTRARSSRAKSRPTKISPTPNTKAVSARVRAAMSTTCR
jgi:spermidine/putrescine-binding protein